MEPFGHEIFTMLQIYLGKISRIPPPPFFVKRFNLNTSFIHERVTTEYLSVNLYELYGPVITIRIVTIISLLEKTIFEDYLPTCSLLYAPLRKVPILIARRWSVL